jgi:hypothetical protein
MAKHSDLMKQATELVIDVISGVTGRSPKDIGLDTLLADFGLSAPETARLLSRILAAVSRVSELANLAPKALDHVKIVRDIVRAITAARVPDRKTVVLGGNQEREQRQQQRRRQERKDIAFDAPSETKPRRKAGNPDFTSKVNDLNLETSGTPETLRGRGRNPPNNPATAESPLVSEKPEIAPRAETERQVSVWIGDESQPTDRALKIGETYSLSFKVGAPVQVSFIKGPEAKVPAADIPPGGLPTEWRVITRDAELTAATSDTSVETETIEDGSRSWCGRFELLIPETGDSGIPQFKVKPLKTAPRIDVIVSTRREVYRQFKILLKASDNPGTTPAEPSTIAGGPALAPALEIGLRGTHEWTTPNGLLRINVIAGPRVSAEGLIDGNDISVSSDPWGTPAQVDGPLKNVRAAAEALRVNFENHFNDIDPADLADRLRRWNKEPAAGWGVPYWPNLSFHADQAHEEAWKRMAVSAQLRELAFHGRALFDAFFPKIGRLRTIMQRLPPGARLNIVWVDGSNFIPHVPWGLMYLADVPPDGTAVDPLGFLGMRCRLAYTCYEVPSSPRAMGAFMDTHRAHFLYWGSDEHDVTGREARWQRDLWKDWGNQIFVPPASERADPQEQAKTAKTELVRLLNKPVPAPTSLLYMFCQSDTEANNVPILRFGDTNDAVNIVKQIDFGTAALADRPLIFANACGTASADTYQANLLEKLFFDRDCRAYLGTEIKVPIALASRFAAIFFHFFYRKLDSQPMAAGEAVAQTRLFLWTHYRNLGGLFYCYINQYDLYVADKQEIQQLRAPP